MGWWGEDKKGIELTLGDGPLDIADSMLTRIVKEYKRDVGRKPTPDELAKTLEDAIAASQDILFDNTEDVEVSELILKFRKVPKRPKFEAGDFAAVELPSGGYGYIRIKDVLMRPAMLIDLLDVYSKSVLKAKQLLNVPVMYNVLSDSTSVIDRSWILLSNPGEPVAVPKRTAKQLHDETNRQLDRLHAYRGSGTIDKRLEKELRERGRLPDK